MFSASGGSVGVGRRCLWNVMNGDHGTMTLTDCHRVTSSGGCFHTPAHRSPHVHSRTFIKISGDEICVISFGRGSIAGRWMAWPPTVDYSTSRVAMTTRRFRRRSIDRTHRTYRPPAMRTRLHRPAPGIKNGSLFRWPFPMTRRVESCSWANGGDR